MSCGDGVVQAWEECDDGNTQDGDGCSAVCESSAMCSGPVGCDASVVDAPVGSTPDASTIPIDAPRPLGWDCQVACDGDGSCAADVDCTMADNCAITCGGANACQGAVTCGPGACTVDCDGAGSCGGGIDCEYSCSCATTCDGPGSCAIPPVCLPPNPRTAGDGMCYIQGDNAIVADLAKRVMQAAFRRTSRWLVVWQRGHAEHLTVMLGCGRPIPNGHD